MRGCQREAIKLAKLHFGNRGRKRAETATFRSRLSEENKDSLFRVSFSCFDLTFAKSVYCLCTSTQHDRRWPAHLCAFHNHGSEGQLVVFYSDVVLVVRGIGRDLVGPHFQRVAGEQAIVAVLALGILQEISAIGSVGREFQNISRSAGGLAAAPGADEQVFHLPACGLGGGSGAACLSCRTPAIALPQCVAKGGDFHL